MKRWVLKAVIQKIITFLPFSFHINYFFQRYVTKGVLLSDDFFCLLLGDLGQLVGQYEKLIGSIQGVRILELGTGWHPIMSVGLYLSGADEIVTTDLRKLIRKANLIQLLEKFMNYYERNTLESHNVKLVPERMARLRELIQESPERSDIDILRSMGIIQIVGDARLLDYPVNYFDITFSVNVLEHVHREPMEGIITTFFEVLKPGGMAYHAIGPYDHFVHVDKSISKFNYLRYSERQWKWIDNDIQPQNRLRISYFRNLFKKTGYTIDGELFWDPEPLELKKITLHPDFQQEDPVETAIPYGTFILTKPASQ